MVIRIAATGHVESICLLGKKKRCDAVMNLTKITTDNLIDIIGTILVIITIGISIFRFFETLNIRLWKQNNEWH